MIIKCSCTNTTQDKIHGKGNRVCNETAKTTGNGTKHTHRCTSCGLEH